MARSVPTTPNTIAIAVSVETLTTSAGIHDENLKKRMQNETALLERKAGQACTDFRI
jgi:hypothetical protein